MVIHVLETGDATGWLRASEGQNPVQGATACCARMALPSSSTPPVLGAAGDAGGGRPLTSSWLTRPNRGLLSFRPFLVAGSLLLCVRGAGWL